MPGTGRHAIGGRLKLLASEWKPPERSPKRAGLCQPENLSLHPQMQKCVERCGNGATRPALMPRDQATVEVPRRTALECCGLPPLSFRSHENYLNTFDPFKSQSGDMSPHSIGGMQKS